MPAKEDFMSRTNIHFGLCLTLVAVLLGSLAVAQSTSSSPSSAVVPPLVNYSGKAIEEGKVITGVAGATFAIYSEESGGSPLWLETQNIQADAKGNYTVQLGATKPDGLPLDLFTSGEARWFGVTINGGQEQPRVMLLSVPYALKAGDAETVGGLPASAFVLATPPTANATGGSETASVTPAAVTSATSSDVTTTGGTVDAIPLFSTATNIQNSLLTQTGTTAINVGGKLNLPALGTATASAGFNSRPQDFVGSSYNSSSAAAVPQTFQWQAEPVGNDTSTPSGSLHLLYGSGTATPAETGLKISNKGLITFATGQTFPTVSGNETVTGNLTASELISTVATGTAPLKVTSTTQVANLNASLLGGEAASAFAQLAAANTFTGNQTVNGNLSATGVVSGSGFQIGSSLFAFGSYANGNAFLGFAGNTTTTGIDNVAVGVGALYSNTTASYNTASGVLALSSNTTGSNNAASGSLALVSNTTGSNNTASGFNALNSNSTGPYNTATGYEALFSNVSANYNTATGAEALYNNTGEANLADGALALYSNTSGAGNTAVGADACYSNTTSNYVTCLGYSSSSSDAVTNATAIGAYARVEQSNSLVLGGAGDHAVNVGIGTTKPSNILTIGRGLGHPVSDSWETYSSRRWKTNIHTLPDALSKVEQLRGVSYDLKDSGKHEIGVIAEEVGAVVPEIVSYEQNGKDAAGVDYSRLTALLIEAVKQQQRLIHQQQAQLQLQQAKINRLGRQVRAVQAAVKENRRTGTEIQTASAMTQMIHP
jgi:hypothetical protein